MQGFYYCQYKKLYAQAYEDLKKEAETNGYLSIDSDIKAIGDSYSYLCDIAKIAGARPPLPGIVEQKRRMLENKKSTADYEEFIFLYNAFEGYVDDDAVFAFNKIRLNGKRKNIASALLMHLSFTEYSVSEKAICLAYDVYLDTFGGSKLLAEELFAKWETYCTSSIDSCSHTYFKLAKKCCENNPTFLEKDEIDFLNVSNEELSIAEYFITKRRIINKSFSNAEFLDITQRLEGVETSDLCEFTQNCIFQCIICVTGGFVEYSTEEIPTDLIDRFCERVIALDFYPSLIFESVFEAWTNKAKTYYFKSAEFTYLFLRRLVPCATADGKKITAEQIEFAEKGNSDIGAYIVCLEAELSYNTMVDRAIESLAKVDFSKECAYIQNMAHSCADKLYRLISSSKNDKQDINMRLLRDFTKGKKGYADVYHKAVDFIKEKGSTHNNAPQKQAASDRSAVQRNTGAVSSPANNSKPKKAENKKEHAPVYLLQMIYGFAFISLSCIDYGDLNTKMQGALTAIWILMLIAYIVITVVSICVTAKKTDMAPRGYMIFIETLLNIACFAINMMIFHVNGGIAATGAFTSVFFINLVIKILCRSI